MAKFNPNSGDFNYLCGGGFDESIIKLSIWHEFLDPKKITAALHKRPTKAYCKGDLSENKKRIMKHGLWQLSTPWVAKMEFEKNLAAFLSKLPSAGCGVWRRLCARYDCELTVVLRMRTWNRGATISAEILREIATRGMKLKLDIYYNDDNKPWADTKNA